MKFGLIVVTMFMAFCSISEAEIKEITLPAIFKSINGEEAVVLIGGKPARIPRSAIKTSHPVAGEAILVRFDGQDVDRFLAKK